MDNKHRILYVVGGKMLRGGTEAYIMNYYRNIDKDKLQIDFIIHGYEKGIYDDEIKKMGGKIYNIPIKSKDYFGNIKALKKIFKSGKHKLVHSHIDAMNMVVLKVAKECGIPVRISHSHNTQHQVNNKFKYLINEYTRKNISKYATHLFGCSEAAVNWLYGGKTIDGKKNLVIPNAINLDDFSFNKQIRQRLRKKLNIENNFVIGHVGRFDYQKNHMFLIATFNEVLKNIPNAKLLLIGDGKLKDDIIEKIEGLGIKENVLLLGVRSDVNDLFNAFDLFMLPSLFEGLPVVGIEAQANGLPFLMSDTITRESDISDSALFLSLEKGPKYWADFITDEIYIKDLTHENNSKMISEKGYNIKIEAKKLENLYIELLKEYS